MDLKKLRVIFVLPNECENEQQTSGDMQQSYEMCKQHFKMKCFWKREADFESLNLQKTDFLVFQAFDDKNLEELMQTKCVRIIGPWCLITCLTEGIAIPNLPYPIYNVAMRDCFITCSYLPKAKKQEIKEKIKLMGGCYTDALCDENTHLITETVKSEKYLKAAETGVELMLSSWVDIVWEESLKKNVHANDPQFTKYKVLPLHNLVICCTGFNDPAERKQIELTITANGGKYTGNLKLNSTDILICKSGTNSDKYKAAKRGNKIKCVNLNWLKDSLEKRYALPVDNYPVKSTGTSTPTKGEENIDPNFSVVSAIGQNSTMYRDSPSRTINETVNNTCIPRHSTTLLNEKSMQISNATLKRKGSPNLPTDYKEAVELVDMKKVKSAGAFLDGCNVYLVGLNGDSREKIFRILNFSGATRFEAINEKLTHIIVGDTSSHELKLIRSKDPICPIVTVYWLLASIENKQPVAEEHFLINCLNTSDEHNSPLSKKGMSLLRNNVTLVDKKANTPTKIGNHQGEAEEIIQQYLNPNASSQDTLAQLLQDQAYKTGGDTTLSNESKKNSLSKENRAILITTATLESTEDDVEQPIFQNLKFLLLNFDEEEEAQLKLNIDRMSGSVVQRHFKGIPDFTVTPICNKDVPQINSEIVSFLWVSECCEFGELRDIMYYHRPINFINGLPLKGYVIALSGYLSYERRYLKVLIESLGGVHQDQFARVTSKEKNILASTHLVSVEASGKKYDAAIKWKKPVVDKDWILECLKTGQLAPTAKYLVGNSIDVSTIDKPQSTPSGKFESSKVDDNNIINKQITASTSISAQNSPANKSSNVSRNEMQESKLCTPNNKTNKIAEGMVVTPVNRIMKSDRTPEVCSQVTPVNKIMQEVRMTHLLGTPESPPAIKPWDHVETPETPLGAFIRDNPTPNLRKNMVRYLNQFPDYEPPKPRRLSTPLSELKRKMWDNLCPPRNNDNDPPSPPNTTHQAIEPSTPKQQAPVDTQDVIGQKLLQLENMLTSSGGSRKNTKKKESILPVQVTSELKESQAYTVGWDYMDCDKAEEGAENSPAKKQPTFMISGVSMDERQEMVVQLEQLGAKVSELSTYDPACTHLICPKPSRNEKLLCCMASGKWILHTSFLDESISKGHFVDEEVYEFGNPKSQGNIQIPLDKDTEARVQAIYWWRKEIARRGYGAFHDMRAILVTHKPEPIIRVIQAGGGMVIDAKPPFEETIYATHCLMEYKHISNILDYAPLAAQGIYCVSTLHISDFLHRTSKDIRDCIIPPFTKYYALK